MPGSFDTKARGGPPDPSAALPSPSGEASAADVQLLEEFERYRTIFDFAPDAYVLTDSSGVINECNTAACELFASSRRALVGRPLSSLITDRTDFYTQLSKVFHGYPLDNWRASAHPVDGSSIELVIHARRLTGSSAQPMFSWVIESLSSSERRMEHLETGVADGLKEADRLRALNDMKTTLLRSLGHDARTPLTVIMGLALTLREKSAALSGLEREDMLDRIVVSAERLNQMLEKILVMNTAANEQDAGALVDIDRMLDKTVAEIDLRDHPIEVNSDTIPAPVDVPKVERILENLLQNAARHTPAGTRIVVSAKNVPGGLLLMVDDEGPGVPDVLKRQIFEPFKRGGATVAGSGIGLSLVSSFASLAGGRAWVEDRPGGGASFRVFLPSAPETDRRRGAPDATASTD